MNLCYEVLVNLWVIFGYVLREIVFLKGSVKFREIIMTSFEIRT